MESSAAWQAGLRSHVFVVGLHVLPPEQSPSERHSTQLPVAPSPLQKGLAPPQGSHEGPHASAEPQGSHALSTQRSPLGQCPSLTQATQLPPFAWHTSPVAVQSTHDSPQCPSTAHGVHELSLQYLPASQSSSVLQSLQTPSTQGHSTSSYAYEQTPSVQVPDEVNRRRTFASRQ